MRSTSRIRRSRQVRRDIRALACFVRWVGRASRTFGGRYWHSHGPDYRHAWNLEYEQARKPSRGIKPRDPIVFDRNSSVPSDKTNNHRPLPIRWARTFIAFRIRYYRLLSAAGADRRRRLSATKNSGLRAASRAGFGPCLPERRLS